ncbi:hypothetical protein KJ657_04290 [Patescibacteria group bacterium]|nr:hypothetical protein [Patescibacteria group bacterium]MBU1016283.1 hypothetical protein [Patescibacteria group bacterium]MBU1685529.1 hypothetical protein [Patescibacteria group bacterium]MBU1938868.1 hypothetical protein [Patescibacteria group bacterium]
MKKYLIILLAIIVLLFGFIYLKPFSQPAQFLKTAAVSANSVLVLDNIDMTRIKIVTVNNDRLTVKLSGSATDLAGILQSEDGIFTKFGFSDEWSNITGTIEVPKGMLIDVTLAKKTKVNIDDAGGKREIESEDSFLIDSSTLNSFESGGSGGVFLNAWGDLIVWDDEQWDILDEGDDSGGADAGDAADAGDVAPTVYCGIGSQAIRDYCCITQNAGEETPLCDGLEYWIFNNVTRDCGFICEANEPEEEAAAEEADCGVGGQAERNTCCAQQHAGEYHGCFGSWRYNNMKQDCEFNCDFIDSVASPGEGEGEGEVDSFGDPVSDYCAAILDENDRNICCNDILKNNLSSGPRAGFPDCIGTWNFDVKLGCNFECAEHTKMLEIINIIRQSIQN